MAKKKANTDFDQEKYEDDGFEPLTQESTILEEGETIEGTYLGDIVIKGKRMGLLRKKSRDIVYIKLELSNKSIIKMPKTMDLKRQFTMGNVISSDILKIQRNEDVKLSKGRTKKTFTIKRKRA